MAFPTETVYGLGADGLNPVALGAHLYGERPTIRQSPHSPSRQRDQLPLVAADSPAIAQRLMQAFWPGPLTLILPKTPSRTGPRHRRADHGGRPDACPSGRTRPHQGGPNTARGSERQSLRPTQSYHRPACLRRSSGPHPLDSGCRANPIGLESTVLDVTCIPPVILRPGGITREAIEAVVGHLRDVASMAQQRRSPGTRYRHYSPNARVWLVEDAQAETLQAAVAKALQHGERVGCLLHRLEPDHLPPLVKVIRLSGSLADYAQGLFSALRGLDGLGLDVIVVEGVQEPGLGVAVMDRRAASPPDSSPGVTQ